MENAKSKIALNMENAKSQDIILVNQLMPSAKKLYINSTMNELDTLKGDIKKLKCLKAFK
jgi:hypothetical protein